MLQRPSQESQSQPAESQPTESAAGPFPNAEAFDHYEIRDEELLFVRDDRHWRVR